MMQWLPENVSTFTTIDSLFYFIYYLTGAVFIVVMVLLVLFLILYRRREGRRAIYSHGNTTLEITWTVIPTIILIAISLASASAWERAKIKVPPSDFEVKVAGKQFNWEILYPGPDRKFGTADDFKVDNDMHVLVNKVIRIRLSSKDVIHSFFLPNLRVKQDAVPGREILVWFEATKTGKYELPCSELCGFGHSGMVGWLYVDTPEDYEKWVRQVRG